MQRALLIVDPQYDFIDGSLPVPGAKTAMDKLAAYLPAAQYALKIITCDMHPWEHCSFQENGGQWPRHCLIHSQGAAIWQSILQNSHTSPGSLRILPKGAQADREEYSIWQSAASSQILAGLLENMQIDETDICGIAGDICVLNTLKDSVRKYGAGRFRLLQEFSPSLDGGKALSSYCEKEGICIR